MVSFLQQGSGGALCVAGGAKFAAVQSVEDAFRGKEAVSVSILCNNTCGSALNFNDEGFRHNCSPPHPGVPALLCDPIAKKGDQQQVPVAAEKHHRAMMRGRTSYVAGVRSDRMGAFQRNNYSPTSYPAT